MSKFHSPGQTQSGVENEKDPKGDKTDGEEPPTLLYHSVVLIGAMDPFTAAMPSEMNAIAKKTVPNQIPNRHESGGEPAG